MDKKRRDFLKVGAATSAAIAGSGTVTGAFAKEFATRTEKIPSASHFGPFYAHVRDGKIVDITAQDSDANPTLMTKALADRNSTNSRVKFPAVRKSYLEALRNGSDDVKPELRGKEEFVRVSWDEALDLVEKGIKKAQKKNGNKALYNAAYSGWSHPGGFKPNVCAGRFFNLIGGAVGTAGEFSNGAAGPVNPTIMGDMEVYSIQTAFPQIVQNTKVMVLWGADLYKNNRIGYSVPSHNCYDAYEDFKKAGIKFISIDPQYTTSAQEFKADWIKIRPNTDVALMLGMMNYLYTSKKYDADFIAKYTDGFDKFLPYLLGKTDGIEKTPAWAAKITEVPEKQIKELADIMVDNRTFLAGNWAMQRASHGEQVDWTLMVLASMIGQIGLPGGGFGFSMHYENGGDAASGKRTVGGLSQGGGDKVGIAIPASRMSDLILHPNTKVTYKGKEITYPEVSFMLSTGASPIGHQPDLNMAIKAMRKLDTIVTIDPWWVPTAKYSDIVLSATTILERDDATGAMSYSSDRIYAMKQIVKPRYESKDDYEIFALLADRFGKKKKFTKGRTPMQWIEKWYKRSYAKKKMKIPFEKFWEEGVVKYTIPKKAYNFNRHEAFRKDPIKNKLNTESGRIQIFSQKFADFGYSDFKGHPMWFTPSEWLGDEQLVKKYPLHMVSPHPMYRTHSQLDNTWIQDVYKIQGREPMMISVEDAKKYDIKDGEIVELYNDRGAILVGAVVTDKIRPGVISVEEGSWYSPENPMDDNSRCNSGQPNVLTSNVPTSQMASATTANSVLVAVRKAGVVKPNIAHLPPKIKEA
ncbi:MAG: biotin sulfoxide reductase [Arcobacter sp.]|nr:MAG: biotin sulfoxide reductase [Arcobacter sp.]